MIYVIWIIYSLLVLIISILGGILGCCVAVIIIQVTDIVKVCIVTRKRRRNRIAFEKQWQKDLDEYARIEKEVEEHRVEKEKYPLFFWKENI